jgi:hypothetical protein
LENFSTDNNSDSLNHINNITKNYFNSFHDNFSISGNYNNNKNNNIFVDLQIKEKININMIHLTEKLDTKKTSKAEKLVFNKICNYLTKNLDLIMHNQLNLELNYFDYDININIFTSIPFNIIRKDISQSFLNITNNKNINLSISFLFIKDVELMLKDFKNTFKPYFFDDNYIKNINFIFYFPALNQFKHNQNKNKNGVEADYFELKIIKNNKTFLNLKNKLVNVDEEAKNNFFNRLKIINSISKTNFKLNNLNFFYLLNLNNNNKIIKNANITVNDLVVHETVHSIFSELKPILQKPILVSTYNSNYNINTTINDNKKNIENNNDNYFKSVEIKYSNLFPYINKQNMNNQNFQSLILFNNIELFYFINLKTLLLFESSIKMLKILIRINHYDDNIFNMLLINKVNFIKLKEVFNILFEIKNIFKSLNISGNNSLNNINYIHNYNSCIFLNNIKNNMIINETDNYNSLEIIKILYKKTFNLYNILFYLYNDVEGLKKQNFELEQNFAIFAPYWVPILIPIFKAFKRYF